MYVAIGIAKEKFDENLKKQFVNTYKLSNHEINQFILILGKGVYPYQYLNDLEKYNLTSLHSIKHYSQTIRIRRSSMADTFTKRK